LTTMLILNQYVSGLCPPRVKKIAAIIADDQTRTTTTTPPTTLQPY